MLLLGQIDKVCDLKEIEVVDEFTTKYTPYLDCYLELLDKAQVELIAFMSASQVGKHLPELPLSYTQ